MRKKNVDWVQGARTEHYVEEDDLRRVERRLLAALGALGFRSRLHVIFESSRSSRSTQQCAKAGAEALLCIAFVRQTIERQDVKGAIRWALRVGAAAEAMSSGLVSRSQRSRGGIASSAQKRAEKIERKDLITREARKIRRGRTDEPISKVATARILKRQFPEELAPYTEATIRRLIPND